MSDVEAVTRLDAPAHSEGGPAWSIAERETALEALLAGHPGAVLSGYTEEGYLTALPEDPRWRSNPTIPISGPRLSVVDLVVPEDRLAIVEGWERLASRGVATVSVHACAEPERTLTLTMFDLRERYGAGIAVITPGQDAVSHGSDEIVGSLVVPSRARQASMRKTRLAVITAADANVTRMLGWEPADLIGLRSSELVHPDDRERAITTWIELLSTKASQRVRLRHACKDGSWLWVEIENIHNGADGDDQVEVESHLTDISDEMAAHEAVTRRERLLRRLAEALPSGVLQIRGDRSTVFANARMAAILDATEPALDDLLAGALPGSRAGVQLAVDAALERGEDSEVEIEVVSPATGESRRLAVSVVAVQGDTDDGEGALICVNDITDSVRLREKLRFQATRDPLTGCLNRSALMEKLAGLLAAGRMDIGVMFLDVDNFKPVNDLYGHAAGDELLVAVARRLQALVREGDLVARLGGDEFLVVGRGLDEATTDVVVRRMHEAINAPVSAAGLTIDLQASIGVSHARPGDTPEHLVARADRAMYECKRRGPAAGPVLYTDSLRIESLPALPSGRTRPTA